MPLTLNRNRVAELQEFAREHQEQVDSEPPLRRESMLHVLVVDLATALVERTFIELDKFWRELSQHYGSICTEEDFNCAYREVRRVNDVGG